MENGKAIHKNEDIIDFTNCELTRFLIKLSANVEQSDEKIIGSSFHVLNDVERIGDHAENITEHAKEMIDGKIHFSEEANNELHHLDNLVSMLIEDGLSLFNAQTLDFDVAKRVIETESSLDSYVKIYKFNHIGRMNSGICSAEKGTIFLDMLTILERVGDHANNVAFSIPRNKLGPILNTATT